MHDAARVRRRQRFAGLHHVFDGHLDRERPARLEHLGQVLPGQMLHHDERHAVGKHPDVEYSSHVLAADLGGGSRFACEALHELFDLERLGAQELQRHDLAQLDVRRRYDEAHAAGADLLDDFVLSGDELAGCEGHFDRLLAERDHAARGRSKQSRAVQTLSGGCHQPLLPDFGTATFAVALATARTERRRRSGSGF